MIVVASSPDAASIDPSLISGAPCAMEALLADANHASHEEICDAATRGVEALIAVPEGPHADTDEAVAAWRARMETPEAQKLIVCAPAGAS